MGHDCDLVAALSQFSLRTGEDWIDEAHETKGDVLMKAMVIYDSQFGNTAQVAQAIAEAIRRAPGGPEDVELRHVGDVQADQLPGISLLVVGSPTQKFSPTQATKRFLKSIPRAHWKA